MAVTPLIEKAVLNGWGVLRNFSLIPAGMAKINIPEGHFGIITDFEYFPFNTAISAVDVDFLTQVETDAFQEVCFYINQRSFKYTFKRIFNTSVGIGPGLPHYLNPLQTHKVDTLIIADADIVVQIKMPQILANGGGGIDVGKLVYAQVPPSPETVGNNENTVRNITSSYNEIYVFPDYLEANTTPSDKTLTTASAIASQLLYPGSLIGTPANNYQLPLVNVTVLMVPEQNRNFLNQRD